MSIGSLPSHSRSASVASDSSDDDPLPHATATALTSLASNGETTPGDAHGKHFPGEKAACQWENCTELFTSLKGLVEHLQADHIGAQKSVYQCLWASCPRKGLGQTSRFALISHLRSHTGEKPFVCSLPECDKSFTRSDALAKHMRQQHNIALPMPGRGSNRKRKRDVGDLGDAMAGTIQREYEGGQQMRSTQGRSTINAEAIVFPAIEPMSDDDEELPPQLAAAADPKTGLIYGRPPAMVKYMITKAKYQWITGEHQLLLGELEQLKQEQLALEHKKDLVLDEVLRTTFGAQAEAFVLHHTDVPQSLGPPTERTEAT